MDSEISRFGDTLTITLRKPVKLGDISYDRLDLREPTGAEWLQWDSLTGVEASIKAISVISGIPEVAVKQIGVRDINEASAFLRHFF